MFGVRNVFDLIHIFTGHFICHFNDAVENMNQSVFCMCSIHERLSSKYWTNPYFTELLATLVAEVSLAILSQAQQPK